MPPELGAYWLTCGRGHDLTPDNVYIYRKGRACKKCTIERNRKLHKDPNYRRRVVGQRTYGKLGKEIPEIWEALYIEQGGRCGVCGSWFQVRKDLVIDHDHQTKLIRGLLCNRCNLGIGLFGDRPRVVRMALEYLEKCHG